MSEVDRWYPNAYGEMQDYPTGEYVLASDYDALRARLAPRGPYSRNQR